jgi:hypothetical protein
MVNQPERIGDRLLTCTALTRWGSCPRFTAIRTLEDKRRSPKAPDVGSIPTVRSIRYSTVTRWGRKPLEEVRDTYTKREPRTWEPQGATTSKGGGVQHKLGESLGSGSRKAVM